MAPRDNLAFADPVMFRFVAPVARVRRPPLRPTASVLPRTLVAAMLFAMSDFAAVALAALVTGLRGAQSGLFPDVIPHVFPNALAGVLVAGLLGVALAALAGLYRREAWEAEELSRLAGVAVVLSFVALCAAPHVLPLDAALFGLLAGAGMAAGRMALRTWGGTAALLRPVMVLVGLGVDRDRFAYQMRAGRAGRATVLRGAPVRALAGLSARGLDSWLGRIAARAGVSVDSMQLVLVPAAREEAAARGLRARLSALGQAHLIGTAAERGPGHGQPRTLVRHLGSDMVLAEIGPVRRSPWDDGIKRGLDLLLTIAAVLALAPLFGLIWAGLRFERGPVLFRQTRVGRGGRRFTCFKFRTMRPDAEDRLALLLDCDDAARAEWERHQKIANDPRVTRLGRMLRASSLDELPQLFNVLRGEMSLVGPRPIIAPEVPGYPADHAYFHGPDFADYADCRPGVTGLWQVCGRHRTSHAERVRLDRWYAGNRSFWLDVLILARTLRVVALGDGR